MQLSDLGKIPTWGLQLLAATAFCFGEIASKKMVMNPNWQWMIKIQLAYMLCTSFWIFIMLKENNLIVQGIIWSTITILTTLAIGHFMFGEVVSGRQMIGIALGIAAIALLSF